MAELRGWEGGRGAARRAGGAHEATRCPGLFQLHGGMVDVQETMSCMVTLGKEQNYHSKQVQEAYKK